MCSHIMKNLAVFLLLAIVPIVWTLPVVDKGTPNPIPGFNLDETLSDLTTQLQSYIVSADEAHQKFDAENEGYHRPSQLPSNRTLVLPSADSSGGQENPDVPVEQSQVSAEFMKAAHEFVLETLRKIQKLAQDGQLNLTVVDLQPQAHFYRGLETPAELPMTSD